MLICYKEGHHLITKDFSSVEMFCTTKGSLFTSAVYSIIGVVGSERVVLYRGLSEKKAKRILGAINITESTKFFGGGIYYV